MLFCLLFLEKECQELAEKIEILIKNKDLREKFGKKSREIIEKKFDVQKVVKETIREYNILTYKFFKK